MFMYKSTMLSTTSDHALRALTHLARLPEAASILGRDLASQAGIPANYLSKILWTLGNAGIIDATRGSGGGYRLKRCASEIRLFEIVELFDRDRARITCFLGGGKEAPGSAGGGARAGDDTMKLNLFLLAVLVALVSANLGVSDNPAHRNFEAMPEMARTAAYKSFSANPNFRDGRSLQLPPEGTIARGVRPLHYTGTPEDAVGAGRELTAPTALATTPERSAQIYMTYGQPCHGGAGKGDGLVARRGFPPPPSLLADHAMRLTDGQAFPILTYGQKNMPSHAAQIPPDDRWRVIAHIRSLQHPPAPVIEEASGR